MDVSIETSMNREALKVLNDTKLILNNLGVPRLIYQFGTIQNPHIGSLFHKHETEVRYGNVH